MDRKRVIYLIVILFIQINLFSQDDDLMNMLSNDEPSTEYTNATFKTTLLVIGQTIETPLNGSLLFNVQHRFGTINSGGYEFFGLDQATTRIGFQYGVNNWLAIGIGRSSYNKTYDGWLKVKILRQSTGLKNNPVSIDYYGNMGITSLKWTEPERKNYFSSRISYANQILLARKLSPGVSLQLMPTYVHYNLVESSEYDNNVFSVGGGGRFKVSSRISLNIEYYVLLSKQTSKQYSNPLSVGIDIETGGHVFQLYATNAEGIIEQHFIGRTSGKWQNGDIHIGFNISRSFQIKKPREFRDK